MYVFFRHEDGTVRFWDASTTSMRMVYKLGTAGIFGLDFGGSDANADSDEEWPPFRKVSDRVLGECQDSKIDEACITCL